ncbi:hypothetical protein AJ80_01862, partial [Polytolypa hystricis UAMH7299]
MPRSSLIRQLNLFAGQLYLRDMDEYITLRQFLGLAYKPPNNNNVRVSSDGFVTPADRKYYGPVMAANCPFLKSPVPFLKLLLELRRKGQSFRRSHLGAILNGELLTEDRFVVKEGVSKKVVSLGKAVARFEM